MPAVKRLHHFFCFLAYQFELYVKKRQFELYVNKNLTSEQMVTTI